MSIFTKMKHGLEHAGDAIKDSAEKAGDGIRHVADKAGDDFVTAADRIAAEAKKDLAAVENEAMSVIDDIKHELSKVADGIKDGFTKAGDEIKADFNKTAATLTHGLEEAFGEATQAVAQIPQDVASEAVKARSALEGVSEELKKDLAKTADAIKAEAEKDLQDIKDGFEEIGTDLEEWLSSDVVKKALEKAHKLVSWLADKLGALAKSNPALVGALDTLSDSIEIGPIKLNYDAFYTRIEDLAEALSTALEGEIDVSRTFIIGLINDLGPTSIEIDLDIEVFMTFGDKIPEMPLAIFTEIADEILKEIGVPEGDDATL